MKQDLLDRYADVDWTAAMTRKQPDYASMVDQLDKFYSGDHSPMLGSTGYLAKIFPQSYKGKKLKLASVPLLSRLIDSAASLFHQRPTWQLSKDGQPLDPADPDSIIWKGIRKETQLDLQARMIQRRDLLWGTCFARPAYRSDKLRIDVLKPSVVSVLESPTDPGNLDDAIAISVRIDADRREIWEKPSEANGWQWTYGLVNETEKTVTDPLFGNTGINGYGMYPFVKFSTHPCPTSVYSTCNQTLLDAAVGADLTETWSDMQFRMGFSIAVLTTSKEIGTEIAVAPDTVVVLTPGQDENFVRVASGLDTTQLTHYIDSKIKRYAALFGVDPDILSTDGKVMLAALTGVSKQMDRIDLQELRQESAVPYEYALPQLFDRLRTVNNWHRPDLALDETIEMEVVWAEAPVPGNALQNAQADRIRIEDGTLTPEEIRARDSGKPLDEVQ